MENNGIRAAVCFFLGAGLLVLSLMNSGISWRKAWSGPSRTPATYVK